MGFDACRIHYRDNTSTKEVHVSQPRMKMISHLSQPFSIAARETVGIPIYYSPSTGLICTCYRRHPSTNFSINADLRPTTVWRFRDAFVEYFSFFFIAYQDFTFSSFRTGYAFPIALSLLTDHISLKHQEDIYTTFIYSFSRKLNQFSSRR